MAHQTLPQFLQAQRHQTPNHLALRCGAMSLTYAELHARVDHLAWRLVQLGVGPDVLVGLHVDRSIDSVVGILGILAAGGAYVPLDPDLPMERLAFMLADATVPVLVTQRDLPRLPSGRARVFFLDDLEPNAPPLTIAPEVAAPRGDNVAYMLYTSGSTGKPKGVLVEHRSVVNFLLQAKEALGMGLDDVVLASTTLSFDIHVMEILLPLVVGASLVMVPRTITRDGHALSQIIHDQNITVFQGTPTMWRMLLTAGFAGKQDLRGIAGGEALSLDLAQQILPTVHELWNCYGPTECAVYTMFHRVTDTDADISIGHPMPGTDAYVLDAHNVPVDPGEEGELFLGGVCVARGYHRRFTLTAARFLPDPFSKEPNARMYRTGDRVRRSSDGLIFYVGRVDHQVKIRGYRIEIGEIEAVLRSNAYVRDAVVVVREDRDREPRLVAYVTPKKGEEDKSHAWRDVWDRTYEAPFEVTNLEEAALNTGGWHDSYVKKPLPREQMRSWAIHTVERIRESNPQHVLEIGCGTGMILLRLAPEVQRYTGVDFSTEAIEYLARVISSHRERYANIRLEAAAADNLAVLGDDTYDTIILNSVSQYFPNVAYLTRILEACAKRITNQGTIFIGDVLDYTRMAAFHTSIELNSRAEMTADELRRRIAARAKAEQLLFVAPRFFHALPAKYPSISAVETLPKQGGGDNEMTNVRYDVRLHVGRTVESTRVEAWVNWSAANLTLEKVARLLVDQKPSVLALSAIPNARLGRATMALRELALGFAGTLQELRERVDCGIGSAVDPAAFLELSRNLSYDAFISLGAGHADGSFDAVLVPSSMSKSAARPFMNHVVTDEGPHTNTPAACARKDPLALRDYVARRLPDYMVPKTIVVLDELPLTPNLKVDRNALPPPVATRPDLPNRLVPPETQLESRIAAVWERIIHVEGIGIHDDFFALGGTSLAAVRFISEARSSLGLEVTMSDLLDHPTVAALVQAVESARSGQLAKGTTPDLAAEAQLDTEVLPSVPKGPPSARGIFLTGGTGFLGAAMLAELLATDAPIHCLVRAASAAEGSSRLDAALVRLGRAPLTAAQRRQITVVCGDLTLPCFGLSKAAFEALAARIGVIHHVGASTNLLATYRMLAPMNVQGTRETIRLAGRTRGARVNYVSTTSVFERADVNAWREVGEEELIEEPGTFSGGYAESKWVAERMLRIAAERGLGVSIYRPGWIAGDSTTLVWNARDLIFSTLRTMSLLGCAPDLEAQLTLLPVDFVARAIVSLAERANEPFSIHPIQPPSLVPFRALVEALSACGQAIEARSWPAFQAAVKAARTLDPAVEVIACALAEVLPEFGKTYFELSLETLAMDARRTTAALSVAGVVCPAMNQQRLGAYVEALIRAGHLPGTGPSK